MQLFPDNPVDAFHVGRNRTQKRIVGIGALMLIQGKIRAVLFLWTRCDYTMRCLVRLTHLCKRSGIMQQRSIMTTHPQNHLPEPRLWKPALYRPGSYPYPSLQTASHRFQNYPPVQEFCPAYT